MQLHFDVAVVGLGAMGSAALHALARRGARAVGFDSRDPPHEYGSSHGETRIIREAYYEHPLYVPLVRRAYELWDDLASEAGTLLFARTGGLMVGPEDGELVRGALESAHTHEIPHEVLDSTEISSRFPAYRAPRDWIAVYEHRAGMLFPERCVAAFLNGARARGATVSTRSKVQAWAEEDASITVRVGGLAYNAGRLVIAAGPWLPELASAHGFSLPLEVERQMSHWFAPAPGHGGRYAADRCPVALWETAGDLFATLPDIGHGVKCGVHHAGEPTKPDSVNRIVSPAEDEAAREVLDHVMPGAAGALLGARVCLYTNTPDRHFVIDWLAGDRILVVSPCSGHGFKFASAIGEVVADLVLDGGSRFDISPFSLSRFAS